MTPTLESVTMGVRRDPTLMNRDQNQGTQPFVGQPVFNNWDVVAKAWYLVAPSRAVRRGQVRGFELCGQRIVVFRGESGALGALDAYCPHMGTDLAIGRVVGDTVRCFFHHWRFDAGGQCVDVPCGERAPARGQLASYAVQEKYGYLWVYPTAEPSRPVPDFPDLEPDAVVSVPGPAYERPCHHHVCMINGIDAQHLRTVHGFGIRMALSVVESEDGLEADFELAGQWSDATAKERWFARLFGPDYAYSMRYAAGSIGLLTTLQRARWLGRGPALEPTRMVFGFTPIAPGRTRVQSIYVARRRPGLLGWLRSRGKLLAMRLGAALLRDEDGKVYDNIRFSLAAPLKMDQPIARFVAWVNRLPASRWSTSRRWPEGEARRGLPVVD
jgi:phenylpropionate dioxygenase-like ring-hydroxylating dioxygenase large terminal subunit